jgi:hypothetical protein
MRAFSPGPGSNRGAAGSRKEEDQGSKIRDSLDPSSQVLTLARALCGSARGSEGDQERRAPKSLAAFSSKDVVDIARSGELSKAVTGAELSKVSEFVVQLCDQ